jgi:hypothetical protein
MNTPDEITSVARSELECTGRDEAAPEAHALRIHAPSAPSTAPHEALRSFAKTLARYELFKKVMDLPGDIVEAGVFRGEGLFSWAKLLQIFNPLSRRKVVGFDTFQGFPGTCHSDHDRNASQLANDCNRSVDVMSIDQLATTARELGLDQRIELVPGDATGSIADYRRRNPGFRVALLYLDFDTYEPTQAALKEFYPIVVPSGVVVFDEYAVRGWGESDAVDQYFAGSECVYHSFPWASGPKAYLVKPRRRAA